MADVVYEDGSMRSAHKYSGPYYDQQSQAQRNGWLSIAFDYGLSASDPDGCRRLYGGGQGVAILANNANRNTLCGQFIKLAVQGRKGKIKNDKSAFAVINEAAREQDERHEPDFPTYQGAAIFVNSLSEETDWVNQLTFPDLLAFCTAHELAHMFIIGNGGDDHFSGNNNNLMGATIGLSNTKIIEYEITHTNLSQRASINRNSNGQVQP